MADTAKKPTMTLREKILDQKGHATAEVIKFFGEDVELRQPTMGAILDAQEAAEDQSRADASADLIIKFAFVPGTKNKVFEESDREQLKGLPFGPDLIRIQTAIARLTGVDVETAVKNLQETPQDTT